MSRGPETDALEVALDDANEVSAPADEPGTAATGTDSQPAAAPAESPEEAVRRERDGYRDQLLRTTADFDNYRKRVERERRELAEFAAADLLRELLPLLDDLERAMEAARASEQVEPYRQGVELIQKQLLDLLAKRGVTPIPALGADFDPHLHQAVAREVSETHRDGEIVQELRRGYRLGDRLLRPAMVKVATRESA